MVQRGTWYVIDYVSAVLALSLASLTLNGISATAAGIVAAAALLTIPVWLSGVVVRRKSRAGVARLFWSLAVLLAPLPLLLLADAVLTGFDVDGLASYVATLVLVYALNYAPQWWSVRAST